MKELIARRGAEQKPGRAVADVVPKHLRERRTEVHIAANDFSTTLRLGAAFGFRVRLNHSALGLLAYIERTAVFGNVLSNFESQSLSSADWTASGQKGVKYPILALACLSQNRRNSLRVSTRLPLVFDDWGIYVLLVLRSRE